MPPDGGQIHDVDVFRRELRFRRRIPSCGGAMPPAGGHGTELAIYRGTLTHAT